MFNIASTARLLQLPKSTNARSLPLSTARTFTCSAASARAPRRHRSVLDEDLTLEDIKKAMTKPAVDDDEPTLTHIAIQDERQTLHYLRLIELEMPKLVAYRKPFVPPTDATPVVVRSIDYPGERHPAGAKRVIVVPVDKLPLKDAAAIHKFKLLAGPRWTPNPPADAGVAKTEEWGNGFIKISCESFPKPAMNLKWASDVLDRLIVQANRHQPQFEHLPVDMRHVYAKSRKAKKGDHLRNRPLHRPSIRDFPKSWLPQ